VEQLAAFCVGDDVLSPLEHEEGPLDIVQCLQKRKDGRKEEEREERVTIQLMR
jgi:hypothetical protein